MLDLDYVEIPDQDALPAFLLYNAFASMWLADQVHMTWSNKTFGGLIYTTGYGNI